MTLTDKISAPPSVYTAYVYDLEHNGNIDISAYIYTQVNIMEGMLNTHVHCTLYIQCGKFLHMYIYIYNMESCFKAA